VRRSYRTTAFGLACAVLAVAAFTQSRSRHRAHPVQHLVSGHEGVRTTASGAPERWSSSAITITLDPSLSQATASAKSAIMDAFGAWASSGANLPPIRFDATTSPGGIAQDGVNRLLFGPITVAGHEHDLAITVSYADEATGVVVEADTVFNSAYDWQDVGDSDAPSARGEGGSKCRGSYDLQNVATHEAGHFFGLGEDYSDTSATMFVSSSPCQTSKRVLNPLDTAAVTALYAEPVVPPAPAAGGCGAQP
jgi:hypothetical protein